MAHETDDPSAHPPREPTAPENFPVSLRCFDTEEQAREFGTLIGQLVRVLSCHFDLSNLDGITIAHDYHQALTDLDRGYETSYKLVASTEFVEGVAMSPSVMRRGSLKSHIIFNANHILPLADEKHEGYSRAVHLLVHECAHIEATKFFDIAFPHFLLRHRHPDLHDACRWGVISGCWSEFIVTWTCAPYGCDPTSDYERCFLEALERTRGRANEKIKSYRLHYNHEQILREVYEIYGDLMKFASYLLGTMAGLGLTLSDVPQTRAVLEGHWFAPFWARLECACKEISGQYGQWTDHGVFETIGDIADDLLADGGVHLRFSGEGVTGFDIPFTADTMPVEAATL